MNPQLNFRLGALLLALLSIAVLTPMASAQVDPGKGGGTTGGDGNDDPIFPGGGIRNNPPNPTPEPFTMILGAGAVGLYARRRYVRSRQLTA